jgi:hypothetical protein
MTRSDAVNFISHGTAKRPELGMFQGDPSQPTKELLDTIKLFVKLSEAADRRARIIVWLTGVLTGLTIILVALTVVLLIHS